MKETHLLNQSSFSLLRTLEEMSIGTKEMKARGEKPQWGLSDFPKIPLYFRRAAINTAIGLAKSYITSWTSWQNDRKTQEERMENREDRQNFQTDSSRKSRGVPQIAEKVECSPVFYKGMYREFHENTIQLKIFNGNKWIWITYPYVGRKIPEEGKMLSPTLKLEKKTAYLHVPVKIELEAISTIQKQIKKEEQICAVSFPDRDTLAVCALIKKDGNLIDSYFIKGGRTREAQRNKVLKRLKKSRDSRRNRVILAKGRENAALYKKLEQINQYYAHKISREILKYCKRNQIRLLVVPNYKSATPFEIRAYLNTNPFHWQGRAIIHNLRYKAFQEGILMASIRPYHISDCCSECGRTILRYNEGHHASKNYYGGRLFLCPEGHKGNAALNTAKNIGRYFLRHFQEEENQKMEE